MAFHTIKNINHAQWLEQRAKGIGSSEVGTILGVNKYDTLYELWMRKTGRAPAKEMTEAMEIGHGLEQFVAETFAKNTGCIIKKSSAGDWLAVDNDREFLRVSPDRLYWPEGLKHCPKNWGIVECKTTSLDVDPDDAPMSWRMQLQYQMGVMGIKRGALAWFSTAFRFHSGHAFYDFDKDFYEKEMLPRLEYFWKENILKDVAPTPHLEAELKIAYPEAIPMTSIEADETILSTYEEIKKLSAEEKAKKKELDLVSAQIGILKNELRSYMKDNEILVNPEGRTLATWKNNKDKETFDLTRFRDEQEETYRQYITIRQEEEFDIIRFRKEQEDTYRQYVSTEKGDRRLSIKS